MSDSAAQTEGRRDRKRRELRERVYERARELFSIHGFDATTVEQIAEAGGQAVSLHADVTVEDDWARAMAAPPMTKVVARAATRTCFSSAARASSMPAPPPAVGL